MYLIWYYSHVSSGNDVFFRLANMGNLNVLKCVTPFIYIQSCYVEVFILTLRER